MGCCGRRYAATIRSSSSNHATSTAPRRTSTWHRGFGRSAPRGPGVRVTCPDVPVPFGQLERAYLPSAENVSDAITHLVREGTVPPPRWQSWQRGPARVEDATLAPGQRARRAELADPAKRYER